MTDSIFAVKPIEEQLRELYETDFLQRRKSLDLPETDFRQGRKSLDQKETEFFPRILDITKMPNISETHIIIISSAIVPLSSPYTPQERFEQTLLTIKSVRKFLPNHRIIFIEMSCIPKIWKNTLTHMVDYFISTDSCPEVRKLKCYMSKSIQEVFSVLKIVENINQDKIRSIFKITGRYELTGIDLSEYNIPDKYWYFIRTEDENFAEQFREKFVHTIFYGIPCENIKDTIFQLTQVFNIILKDYMEYEPIIHRNVKSNDIIRLLDIEHIYNLFPDKKFVDKTSCQGGDYKSINYQPWLREK